jgi:DNA-directed RNA polymerase specialized sigma24 family protein
MAKTKRTALDRAADEWVEELFDKVYWWALHDLSKYGMPAPPHPPGDKGRSPWIEDCVQDWMIEFMLILRSGKVRHPRGFLRKFIKNKCADFWNRKDSSGLQWDRQNLVPLSLEVGGRDKDGDKIGLTLEDTLPSPRGWRPDVQFWDKQAAQERLSYLQKLRRDMRAILADDPALDLWKLKAAGLDWHTITEKVPGSLHNDLYYHEFGPRPLWARSGKRNRVITTWPTYAEIGKAVGLTGDQVRGRLARSAPRLRKQLRRRGYKGRKKISHAA